MLSSTTSESGGGGSTVTRRQKSRAESSGIQALARPTASAHLARSSWRAGSTTRLGFHAVFYGQTLIGPRRPNLTYMLAFDDMADHDARWGAFGKDPEFRALVAKPENSDAAIVSSISNVFLRPGPGSQL